MAEFWVVFEVVVNDKGARSASAKSKSAYNEALNVYYTNLATGATSGTPYHATYLVNSKNGVEMMNIYNRAEG